MVTNRIIFFATSVQPNPEEIDYWVDLSDNPYGGSIKYFNGTEWVRLAASGGTPDLSNYYTKIQVNKLLNDKANIGDVDSKVDDEEVKDVIKDIQFNTSNPNGITMVMFKYDGSNKTVSIPVASTSSAGIITSKDFLDFVKQHQLQELHTEMIDTFADIRAKYQKKLIAGLNIEIDQETNVISASGDLAVQWDSITNKPDFKPVATSGDYNDLINKLKPGKDVSISEDNVISIAIDSDSLEQSLATLQSNIDKEAATARAAETKLGNDIATEKNRAENAEQKLTSDLTSEVTRAKGAESANATAIANEVERATGVEETLNSNITQLQTQKVDKVEGKGLSTNDYTTPEKNKLAAIEAEANKYVLPAATTTTLGGIIVGDRLSIDDTGKLVATYTYTLPTASSSVLGGVKTGSNITNTDGTISLTKANVTSALGVDPTTTYVKKAGDTMTGILNIKNSEGAQLELFSTASDGGAYMRFYPNNQTDNKWYLGVGTNQTLNLGYNTVTKASFGDGQLSLTTSANLAPIKTNSTTLCTNLNADLLDGKQGNQYYLPSGIFAYNTNYVSNDTHLLQLLKINITTNYASYIVSASSSFWGMQHYSSAIFSINCNNNDNFGNISPKCAISILSRQDANENIRFYYYKIVDNTMYLYVLVFGGNGYGTWKVNIISANDASTANPNSDNNRYGDLIIEILPNQSKDNIKPISQSLNTLTNYEYDWYGVSWSETSSNPDCTRIGNMDMHRTLPIQSMMKGYALWNTESTLGKGTIRQLTDDWSGSIGSDVGMSINTGVKTAKDINIFIKIPEFWYTDEYDYSTNTHNLKISPNNKPGWNHHKEAYVGAYEGYNDTTYYRSTKDKLPTVNVTRSTLRPLARANSNIENDCRYNIYTYEEHRAICHLFLVEYATRNSQKAVNTELTPEGFRQGGLGSGCTTGTVTINGATTYSFIPTGSSDSLGNGSGEVTVTIQQTDSSGANTTTTTRKCNRYRGIENPFGHVWKHTDDVISVYNGINKFWSKCYNPKYFANTKNSNYINLCGSGVITGYKTSVVSTPTCDFFAAACTNGSESTYWCDYNWDNTDTSEHCLLIGGPSAAGGQAGLFLLHSYNGVSTSSANVGSRLTYLPWAE